MCIRDSNGTEALHNINLKVEKGEFVFIVGSSGAGKSTFLKLITCEERPNEGQVLIDGQDISHIRKGKIPYVRRKMGLVFQDFRLIDHMTVYDNVAFGPRTHGIKSRADLDEIVELMVETVCAKRKTTRIAGSDFPHEIVRSRFLKLDSEHIRFVMDSLQKNTTEVRNMKQYLLTVLFNAPTTISNHYTSQVNHDMNAGGW